MVRPVVHCYLADIVDPGSSRFPGLVSTLGEKTRARLGPMSGRRRAEFVTGRLLLRHAAALHLPKSAAGERDLPELVENGSGLPGLPALVAAGYGYSLSHSRDLALVALARGAAVGIDIEYARPGRDLDALADEIASGEERDWIATAAGEAEQVRRFYLCWTRKESLLKMKGWGIGSVPLQELGARDGWTGTGGDGPGDEVLGYAGTWRRGIYAMAVAATERFESVLYTLRLTGKKYGDSNGDGPLVREPLPLMENWLLTRKVRS